MAYETKVILTMLANDVVKSKSLEEVYNFIAKAASVEGLNLPTYAEAKKEFKESKKPKTD